MQKKNNDDETGENRYLDSQAVLNATSTMVVISVSLLNSNGDTTLDRSTGKERINRCSPGGVRPVESFKNRADAIWEIASATTD